MNLLRADPAESRSRLLALLRASVVVLEDVITSGGSALKAVERVREAGLEAKAIFGLVDRLEGGRARIEGEGLPLITLFDRNDFPSEA